MNGHVTYQIGHLSMGEEITRGIRRAVDHLALAGMDGGGDHPGWNGGYPGGGGYPHHGAYGRYDGHGTPNLEKLFDDKVALSNDYTFDGGAGGDKWRIKVEGYWIAKMPALLEVIEWVSKQDGNPLSKESIEVQREKEVGGGRWKDVLTGPVLDRVNGIIWGFLNLCLKGEAHRSFQMAPRLNGLEGWRMVVSSIHRGRDNRQAQLRKLIRNPPSISKLEDVEMGIVNFDSLIRDYVACDGSPPNDLEKKTDLLDMLPNEIRENLLWRATDSSKTYEEFRDHIKVQANHVLYHRGKFKGQINSVEQGAAPQEYGDEQVDGIIAAIQKRMGSGGGQRPPRRPDGAEGAGGGGGDTRCVNCGSKEHTSMKCPEPKVAFEKRPCYKCNKPGHLARNCKAAGSGTARRVNAVEEDEPEDFGGLCGAVMEHPDSIGSPPVADPTWRRPKRIMRPSNITLADYVVPVKNSFKSLAVSYNKASGGKCGQGCDHDHSDEQERSEGSWITSLTSLPAKPLTTMTTPTTTTTSTSATSAVAPPAVNDHPVAVGPAKLGGGTPLASPPGDVVPPNLAERKMQGDLRSIFKIGLMKKNAETSPKPTPKENKLKKSIGKHCFDKIGKEKKISQMMIQEEPNTLLDVDVPDVHDDRDDNIIAIITEDDDDEEILNTEEVREVEVALDSGCCKHSFSKEDLPGTVEIRPLPPGTKEFVGAGGHGIKRHGSAAIQLQQEGYGPVNQVAQIADVTRPLHALCQIADTDKEILYTKGEAVVVPGGSLSKYLKFCKKLAVYKRRGGLYLAKMKIRMAKPRRQPFAGQGAGR